MALINIRRSRVFAYVIAAGALVAAVFFVGGPALDKLAGRTRARQQPSSARVSAAELKLTQLQQRVQAILQATLRAHPQLEERQQELGQMVREKMKAGGHDPAAFEQRMQTLRVQLDDKKLGDGKRRELLAELRSAVLDAQRAEQQALQDPRIKQAADAFQRDLLLAMSKQDPSTPSLLQQLRQVQQELHEASAGG